MVVEVAAKGDLIAYGIDGVYTTERIHDKDISGKRNCGVLYGVMRACRKLRGINIPPDEIVEFRLVNVTAVGWLMGEKCNRQCEKEYRATMEEINAIPMRYQVVSVERCGAQAYLNAKCIEKERVSGVSDLLAEV